MTARTSGSTTARRVRRARDAARRPGRPRRPGARPQARPALRRADPDRRDRAASWRQPRDDLAAARELAAEDAAFAAEAPSRWSAPPASSRSGCAELLVPRDPNDDKDVILEVKAGEGGEESALFAGDLLRMYLRYAERRGWKTEMLDATESDLGGYKDVAVAVKSAAPRGRRGRLGPAEVRGRRAPRAAGAGRPSPRAASTPRAAGVLVLPEAEEVEVEIDPNDLRIDVFRSSGPGGQSVNTTDSAVRITHLPTGIVVVLPEREEPAAEQGAGDARSCARGCSPPAARRPPPRPRDARRSQVRTVDRSERIRTYNFPENRISDHRVGYKALQPGPGARRRPRRRSSQALRRRRHRGQLAAPGQ